MKLIPEKEFLQKKKNKEEPLCPKCKVELELDCNELGDVKVKRKFLWWKWSEIQVRVIGGLFYCPICNKRFYIKDYWKK